MKIEVTTSSGEDKSSSGAGDASKADPFKSDAFKSDAFKSEAFKSEAASEKPGRYEERTVETRQTAVRFRETPDALELTMDMPGTGAEDLAVSLRGRKLTVEYEKREETRTSEGGLERVESRTEKRVKEVELPKDVNPDKVDAVHKDGVLTITLGKR